MRAGEEDHARPGWTPSRRGQDSPWKSQLEWQKTEINAESTSMVRPALGSRTAREQNSQSVQRCEWALTSVGLVRRVLDMPLLIDDCVCCVTLPSVGFRSWSRFLAVSLQVTWVVNPVVGCHYFPPDLQLPPQPLRELLRISLLGEQRHDGREQFA